MVYGVGSRILFGADIHANHLGVLKAFICIINIMTHFNAQFFHKCVDFVQI